MGAGTSDDLESVDILVAIAASAHRHYLGLPRGRSGLLIADECHRYTSENWRAALEDDFESRLGLTATYEAPDGGDLGVLDRYFDGLVYSFGYAAAVTQGVIAPFRVGLVSVAFTGSEQEEYDELTGLLRAARKKLVALGAPREPYSDFIQFVNQVRDSGTREEGIAAGRYWKASTSRRDLLAAAEGKSRAVESLAKALEDSSRSIVFTQTIDSAEEAAAVLTDHGIRAAAIHSDLAPEERDSLLRLFEDGGLDAVVAPRILDEGIDVPEADVGVILAASRRRRQMIQRMGRVIRRKEDGRAARFVIVFVEGTSEDPDSDAHEAFLDEMLKVAEEIRHFRLGDDDPSLRAFLAA
jgi:RNA polymerase primary sigma factor